MIGFFSSLYITNKPFYGLAGCIVLFILSFFIPWIYYLAWIALWLLLATCIYDIYTIYLTKSKITAKRIVPEKLSNGDDNTIAIEIHSNYTFDIKVEIIDEIPIQFQNRNFLIHKTLASNQTQIVSYILRPNFRGEYLFGNLIVYSIGKLGLFKKRSNYNVGQTAKVYPSIIQLKKYDLKAIHNNLTHIGLKKIRRIGQSTEFEKIKEYAIGDNIKTINWKATAKRNQLMVNQFQEEKNQNIYLIIDKGRVMQMPFQNLTLLDYSINASLVMANTILQKTDKAGMFTFSKKVENVIVADNKINQLHRFLDNLYKIEPNKYESNYSRLFVDIKKYINSRSLLLLFSNFETLESLQRQLPYLRAIAKQHVLVVIFFENTELVKLTDNKATTTKEIYDQVIAQKYITEKKLIVNELMKYGIYSVLTKPENLTIDTINKYLEIKAKGLI
nr:DUF58 domain-containing protein [uncultured Flavobacterium sp.]